MNQKPTVSITYNQQKPKSPITAKQIWVGAVAVLFIIILISALSFNLSSGLIQGTQNIQTSPDDLFDNTTTSKATVSPNQNQQSLYEKLNSLINSGRELDNDPEFSAFVEDARFEADEKNLLYERITSGNNDLPQSLQQDFKVINSVYLSESYLAYVGKNQAIRSNYVPVSGGSLTFRKYKELLVTNPRTGDFRDIEETYIMYFVNGLPLLAFPSLPETAPKVEGSSPNREVI